ncbi:Hpt domain-containing protein [Colwellia sp. D2M02]|uniref:Hpt domain-containing protein n=1 Tax=Colwellia sp. D2M02 TaxID=2841562 RepID=UPI001C0978F3|nr:Hpt domain-containing protein [Colwellia sp. D2M02]
MSTKQVSETLNIELLQGYFDTLGKEMLEKMYALYRQQTTIYLADINNAVTQNSESLWQESCHKMKGAAASVGLVRLHSRLVTLEKITADSVEKEKLLAELTQQNNADMKVFESWLSALD